MNSSFSREEEKREGGDRWIDDQPNTATVRQPRSGELPSLPLAVVLVLVSREARSTVASPGREEGRGRRKMDGDGRADAPEPEVRNEQMRRGGQRS